MHATSRRNRTRARTLVVGLGATGLSVVRRLAGEGATLAVADSREAPPGLAALQREHPDVAVFLGPFDEALFHDVERLVVSPGVPLATPQLVAARARGVEVVGDVELFVRRAQAPIVAITGSNGKSSVTTLVGEIATACGIQAAVGGNLGRPALDLLDDAVELYVLELSSFQLEGTDSLQAAVAAVLNLSPDHMDRYPDLAAYAAAKARILRGAGVGVCNADDPIVSAMSGADDRWRFTLGVPDGDKTFGIRTIDRARWLCRGRRPLLAVEELPTAGAHNLANALAALAIGTALGCDTRVMREVLRRFRGLPHRTQFVAAIDGVDFYDDSKATNVGAAVAALRGLDPGDGSRTVLIAGGDCKGADLSALAPALRDCARGVVLIGRDAAQVAAVVPGGLPQSVAADLREAVDLAAGMARPGDRVLLSPACASLDMFKDFAERGERFVEAVLGRAR